MYNDLYEAWKLENQDDTLGRLPPDFYSKVAEYIKKLEVESRMLDKKTVKARLLENETRNVKRMAQELIQIRYKKLVINAARGVKTPLNSLPVEEKKMYTGPLPPAETNQAFIEEILRGNTLDLNAEREEKKAAIRFLDKVPSIVGSDMKTYGPFQVEDVATLPVENCRILVKKGLAERIEV